MTRILSDHALYIIDDTGATEIPLSYLLNLNLGSVQPRNLPYQANISIDASQGANYRLTLTGDCTLSPPINGRDFQTIELDVNQDAIGGHILNLGSGFKFSTDAPATYFSLSTVANAKDLVKFRFDAPSQTWLVTALIRGF